MDLSQNQPQMAVISDPKDFDNRSGSLLERLIFNNRGLLVLCCAILTAFFAFQLRDMTVSASFDKMLPHGHPYITNYLENREQLRGLGDSVRVVVENPKGDIFNADYLATLAKINDEIFILKGVDRAWMKSIFTPVVRWVEVTEEGFTGGPVLPNDYDGSAKSIEDLRINIGRAGVVGSLVGNNYQSSMIQIPLLAKDAEGKSVDYHQLSASLEQIRAKYASGPDAPVKIYVIGFAKLAGDLIDGLEKVMVFFLIAAAIATFIIYLFTRCVRSTSLVLACSLVAVVWQLGLVVSFGYGLDPFSILVPFLVFAIGISHGAQKMNGIMQDVGRGTHKLVAARYTFRRLFLAGLTALLADAVGFAVLTVIDTDTELGARIFRTGEVAVAEGDFSLMGQGKLKLSYLTSDDEVLIGDQIVTSGLGGYYPSGLVIGSVESLQTGDDGLARYAVLTPMMDFNALTEVFVITDYDIVD